MRIGANTFIWRSPFSTNTDLDLLGKLKTMGFDLIEVAVEDPGLINLESLKDALEETGLGVVTCGAFGPGRNLSSLEEVE
ncbi:MAG: sugar phosphate isomerase/epimerase, partial [Anaerolineales bacterium]